MKDPVAENLDNMCLGLHNLYLIYINHNPYDVIISALNAHVNVEEIKRKIEFSVYSYIYNLQCSSFLKN